MLESVAARHLLEVLHTAFDERLIREVRDIAIEPSARTLGVAHLAERYSPFVGKNIYGEKYQPLFANGVKYFK